MDGVLLLDKPPHLSSQAAVTGVKNLFFALKAGHTGTLDPMACGLLPVCLGEATKFSHMLLDGDKTYAATIKLGVITATGDMEGEVIATAAVNISRAEIEAVLPRFRGSIMQTPPMYSALKHAGQPLYKYARAGVDLPRAPRPVTIFALDFMGLAGDQLEVVVRCSKGTYIRVLAEDIGRELGCGACLAALKRTAVGTFRLDQHAITLEALQDMRQEERESRLLPVDSLVTELPRLDLSSDQARRIIAGQEVAWPAAPVAGLARIYGPGGDFLGVAEFQPTHKLAAKRLLAQHSSIT